VGIAVFLKCLLDSGNAEGEAKNHHQLADRAK
jgi:hypothetical protein